MEIRARQVQQSLETVDKRLKPILDDRSGVVIAQAKSKLRVSKCQYDESTRQRRQERPIRPWGFSIEASNPLRFKTTEIDGLKLRVDLFLRTYWCAHPAEQPDQLSVVIRVWCLDQRIYFREKWDASGIEGETEPDNGRVMLRIHFDLANTSQPGPKYHLQVGGRQHCGELHWFPEALSVPRMIHMPMDLVLASELVAATFYPDEYRDLRREDLWSAARKVSQQHLLHGYFEEAFAAASNNKSVLEALWNVPFE